MEKRLPWSESDARIADRTIVAGDCELDPSLRRLRRGDHVVTVTRVEAMILMLLMQDPFEVVSLDELGLAVWGEGRASIGRLHVHVFNLRRKLNRPGLPKLIANVTNAGYRFAPIRMMA